MNTALTMLSVLTVASGVGCHRGAGSGLTLSGSTSLQPFAEKWADAYQARRPGVSIAVQGGGSTAGVQAAISGAAEIGLASRALTPDEASRVTAIAVARDGIAIVVNPANPVSDLDLAQVREIYAARRPSWGSLGGPASSITVITREDGSGTRAAFEALVMNGVALAASTLVQDSTGAVRQMVASDPAAIGYISIGLVDASVKAVSLRGVAANEANIDAGAYPLVRPFLFVMPRAPSARATEFAAWVTGPEGRDITRREGLLPPVPEGPHAGR